MPRGIFLKRRGLTYFEVQEQIKVLESYGVEKRPETKEEATRLIRDHRDMEMAKNFGLDEALKRDPSTIPPQVPYPELQDTGH